MNNPPKISYNEFLEGVYRGKYKPNNPKLRDYAVELKRARNAWGEGRSQGRDGMHLINQAVTNRANSGGKWGWSADPYDVMVGSQFSAWRPSDPNYKKMMGMHRNSKDPQFKEALKVVGEKFPEHLKKFKDVDHYYAPAGVEKPPHWASSPDLRHLGDHGGHKLYTTKPAPKPAPKPAVIPGFVTGKQAQPRG